jgi:hypothetical protein
MVHAKDDGAKAFYQRFRFEPSPADPFRLFLLMKDIKASLGVSPGKRKRQPLGTSWMPAHFRKHRPIR